MCVLAADDKGRPGCLRTLFSYWNWPQVDNSHLTLCLPGGEVKAGPTRRYVRLSTPSVVDIKETTHPPRTSVLRSRETAMRSAEGTFIRMSRIRK